MPINFTDYSNIPAQKSAFDTAFTDMQKAYDAPTEVRQKRANLKRTQIDNMIQDYVAQYAPEVHRSSMDTAQAQRGLTGAQTGLAGAQAQQYGIQNQYLPNQYQQEAFARQLENQQAQRDASVNKMFIDTLNDGGMEAPGAGQGAVTPEDGAGYDLGQDPMANQNMGGMSMDAAQQGQPSQAPYQASPEEQLAQDIQSQPQVQEQEQPQPQSKLSRVDQQWKNNPLIRAQAKKYFPNAGEKTEWNKATGELIKITTYPSGKTETEVIPAGMTAEQLEREKGFAKSDVDKYDAMGERVAAGENMQTNYDYINETVAGNEQLFDDNIGPLRNKVVKLLGSEEAQTLLGELETSLGNIMLETSKGVKGAFTGKDQAMINKVKPTLNDTPSVFRGKMKALTEIHRVTQERNMLAMDLIRNHNTQPAKAMEMARAAIEMDVKGVTDKARSLDMVTLRNSETGKEERVTRAEANKRMGKS